MPEVHSIQGLLWKAKRGVASVGWKKHWVYADNNHIRQWSGKTRPLKGEEPKYMLDIAECEVKPSKLRQFAFEITEQSSGGSMIFAADDSVSYRKWMKILTEKIAAKEFVEEKSVTDVTMPSLREESVRHDEEVAEENEPVFDVPEIVVSPDEPPMQNVFLVPAVKGKLVTITATHRSIAAMDQLLQADRIIRFLRHDIRVSIDEQVEAIVFRRFWKTYGPVFLPVRNVCSKPMTAVTRKKTGLQSSSFLTGCEHMLDKSLSPAMFRIAVPTEFSASAIAPSSFSNLTTARQWYDTQSEVNERLAQAHGRFVEVQRACMAAVSSGASTASLNPLDTKDLAAAADELTKAIVNVAALWEAFRQTANKGAQTIFEEYTLPDSMKTVKPITIISAVNAAVPIEILPIATYEYNGLHLYPIIASKEIRHLSLDAQLESDMQSMEELLSSVATNQLKESMYINDALNRVLYAERMDSQYLKNPEVVAELLNLRVKRIFNGIFDYGGLRIAVTIPSDELVRVAVIPNPAMDVLMDNFSIQLKVGNIVHSTYLMEWLPNNAAASVKELNVVADQLLPPELIRGNTHDAMVKRFRGEFLQSLKKQLPSLLSMNDPSLPEDQTAAWIAASKQYYTEVLTETAQSLDAYIYTPFDSYSLTTLLHSKGVNVRHLGVLYSLCRNMVVRQLIFGEMVARCCKQILRGSLRALLRKRRAEALLAEYRKKSKPVDYEELRDMTVQQQCEAVLQIFNHIFPHLLTSVSASIVPKQNRAAFFKLLCETMMSKFGIPLRPESELESSPIHPPHLFLALQYHLNVRFKEESFKNILHDRLNASRPFNLLDVVDFFMPKTKLPNYFVGEVDYLLAMKEQFLSMDLYEEASALFELDLLLQTKVATPQSWQQISQCAHATYSAALCRLLQSKWQRVSELIKGYLRNPFVSLYSIGTGRLLTQLMTAEHHQRKYELAMYGYDSSSEILQRYLPPNHPLIVMPIVELAELYAVEGKHGIQRAKVLLQIACAVLAHSAAYSPGAVSSLQLKLAAIYINLEEYREAINLLTPCLKMLDDPSVGGKGGDVQLISCLYHLCWAHYHCDEHDLAMQYGQRCMQSITATKGPPSPMTSSRGNGAPGSVGVAHWADNMMVSLQLVLFDVHSLKGELDLSLERLQGTWRLLRTSESFRSSTNLVHVLLQVALKAVELVVSSLPMQSRLALESIAQDWRKEQDMMLQQQQHAEVDALWRRVCVGLVDVLWRGESENYILLLLNRIQDNGEEMQQPAVTRKPFQRQQPPQESMAAGFDKETLKLVDSQPLHVQAAAVTLLVHRPLEFAELYVSIMPTMAAVLRSTS